MRAYNVLMSGKHGVLSPSLIRTPMQSTLRAALALSRVTNDRLRLPLRR